MARRKTRPKQTERELKVRKVPARPPQPRPAAPRFRKAARLGELPEGRALAVRVGGLALALFNVGGRVYALDDCCSHAGRTTSLSQGVISGEDVLCPLHGWKFDLQAGECSMLPGVRVRTYAVRLRGVEILVEC